MSRAVRSLGSVVVLALTAVALGGAKGNEVAGFLFLLGLPGAVTLLALLPLGLLVQGWRPGAVRAVARAYERRGTAALLVGAGVLLLATLVSGVLQEMGAGGLIALELAGLVALTVVGFAGCSLRQGLRLRGDDVELDDDASCRPLLLGWLARSGAAAAPVLWPVVSLYLLATACGAPLVALASRGRDAPAEA